jgi:4-amino-4-deoxy-L-arabinose transferase-like glycosyltransferase
LSSDSAYEPNAWFIRAALLIAFIAINLPLLAWTEFHNSEESVNVATAMELLRDGHWKVPTLGGSPRLVKPPLAAWTAAAAIPRSTLAALDGDHRKDAYRKLTREVRVPAMLCAALVVIGVYEIGRALAGWKVGLAGAACASTNFLLLSHASLNTTDIQLAAWVTLADAFMAHAILRKKHLAWLGAGAALGLALMSKGPLALLQSVLPVTIFLLWRREKNLPWRMISFGALLMLLIGAWWYAWIGATTPGVWTLWLREVTRHHANNLPASDWWRYFSSFWFFFPWVLFIIIGLGQGPFVMWWRSSDVVVLPWLLLVVPFAIMCFFHERKERYLLPLVAPAAVIAGKVLLDLIAGIRRGDRKCNWLLWIHWALTAALAIGLPIVGTTPMLENLRTETGDPVFTKIFGYTTAAILLAITLIGILTRRRQPLSILFTGMIVFFVNYIIYVHAMAITPAGHCGMRPIAERIRASVPGATYYSFHPSQRFEAIMADSADLSIYTNRTITWTRDPASAAGPFPRVWFTIGGKPFTILNNSAKRRTIPPGSRLILHVFRRGAWQMFFEQIAPPASVDLK